MIVDGLNNATAEEELGFLEGWIEAGRGLRTTAQSILPSLSRPCYASIFTGVEPFGTGILSNRTAHRLSVPSVFDAVRAAGGSSAISGYHWMSELYHEAPFDPVLHRNQEHNTSSYTHGRFYFEDTYPDSHVYADAESLRLRHSPELVVIHPMGVDDIGHKFGGTSKEYRAQAAMADALLAVFAPGWLRDGYQVLVTADHGMNPNGSHGGTTELERVVPLYLFSPKLKQVGVTESLVPQLHLAHLFCHLLGVEKAATMASAQAEIQSWFEEGSTTNHE
ncbi:alkaline phosphatase family protein [Alicyclobacillus sp. ALC3]|uniref:alkaline phosphatase family protein n=1 Tax=Alicyclobacillus sp. ALC3 TaxID=2796143 RepID=UPI002377DB79|nr:alkaline phosphatase family protein [Alicyclobacillus sp. ALC3]WDL99099.1 alkaline phosphatase family protein [Alicyclobacillus sp. ALC3]